MTWDPNNHAGPPMPGQENAMTSEQDRAPSAAKLSRRIDGTAHVQLPNLPGFHVIFNPSEDAPAWFLETLNTFIGLREQALRAEAFDAGVAAAAARARAAAIEEFLDCCEYDVLMEGPKFKNWNLSRLNRLRAKYEAELAMKPRP